MAQLPALGGRVCVVTGASRGIGKGIAKMLGKAGATVYITGRTLKRKDGEPGSLEDTAKEIESEGGRCIPVACDHGVDEEVKNLFERVQREQDGQLDILVNNAYAAVDYIAENTGKKFWEDEPGYHWDISNKVGLRNHFICTVYASRLMLPQKKGLIVNVSSMGGLRYLFDIPYGVGKSAVDRMAADCAVELRKHNVAMVSLWPGPVRTEKVCGFLDDEDTKGNAFKKISAVFSRGETTTYAGKSVVFLANDSNVMKKSGKILMTTDLGEEYGFVDEDDRVPMHSRGMKDMLAYNGNTWLAAFMPRWAKIPRWLLHMASYKF